MWAGKVMASVFWDAHGVLFIDYLEKGETINSERYIGQLMRLKDEIAEKRLQMKKKKVLFHQDNAPCHKSLATMAKLQIVLILKETMLMNKVEFCQKNVFFLFSPGSY